MTLLLLQMYWTLIQLSYPFTYLITCLFVHLHRDKVGQTNKQTNSSYINIDKLQMSLIIPNFGDT